MNLELVWNSPTKLGASSATVVRNAVKIARATEIDLVGGGSSIKLDAGRVTLQGG